MKSRQRLRGPRLALSGTERERTVEEPKVLKIPAEGIWVKNSDLATKKETVFLHQLYPRDSQAERVKYHMVSLILLIIQWKLPKLIHKC